MNPAYPKEKLLLVIAGLLSLPVWAALGWLLQWGLLAIVAVLGLARLLLRSALVARLRGDGVRIGALQFTELNARLLGVCRRLGMDGAPELVLLRDEAGFGPMAVSFLGRDYLVLHANVLQALEPLPAALDFYLGHGIASLRRDRQIWRGLLLPARFLPLIGTALERAAVYGNDRQGLLACENPAYAKIALAAMAAGAGNWKKVNLRTYEEQVGDVRGFWCSYHELAGDQPWLVKRMATLSALAEKQAPQLPARNPLAWLAALLTPRLPSAGGLGANLALIAVVAAAFAVFGMPQVREVQRGRAVVAAYAASKPVRAAIDEFSASQLRFPAAAELHEAAREIHSGDVTARIEATDGGRIAILFSGGGELDGRTLLVYATPFQGSYRALNWNCSGEFPQRMRPHADDCEWVEVDAPAAMAATSPPPPGLQPAAVAPAAPAAAPPAAAVADEQAAAIAAELHATRGDPAAMTLFNRMMVANAINAADSVKALAQRYHQTNKAWPQSLADTGYPQGRVALDNEGSVVGTLAMGKGGQVNVQIEGGVFNGRVISFKPRMQGNLYNWTCSGGGIPAEYLSGGCR